MPRDPRQRPRPRRDPNLHDITVVSRHDDDMTMKMASLTRPGSIAIVSMADMVSRVLHVLGPKGKIASLSIWGHGNPKGLRVGRDRVRMDNPKAFEAARKLAPRFAPDAKITLHSCDVGQNPALLRKLSEAFGGNVLVRAGEMAQMLFPGLEGPIVECTASSCTRTDWGVAGLALDYVIKPVAIATALSAAFPFLP